MPLAQSTNVGEIDINKYVASPVLGIFVIISLASSVDSQHSCYILERNLMKCQQNKTGCIQLKCKLLYGLCVCTGRLSTSFSEWIISRTYTQPCNNCLFAKPCMYTLRIERYLM